MNAINKIIHSLVLNKHKNIMVFWLMFIACIGCTMSIAEDVNLDSPENTYETSHYAIRNKDFGIYSKCFYLDGDKLKINNLKQAAELIFNNVKVLNKKIIKKDIINDSEAILTAEEVVQRSNDVKSKSTIRIKFIKQRDEWKIVSSDTIEIVRDR